MRDNDQRFNPFPGLRAFQPDEEHLFFGREKQIDELLRRLRRTHFLAVVGTSGSGKSSLVMSGLIPALHGGFMVQAGSRWRVAIFRPGDDPIGNMAAALNTPDVLGGDEEHEDIHRAILETTLRRGARGLAECVRQARARKSGLPENDNLLIVADQFEELFRFKRSSKLKDSGDQAVAFVKLLLESTRHHDLPIYIVLTMRTDFLENCVEYPGLPESINRGAYLVPRMNRDERRRAIEGPVAVGGGTIAPRLVAKLLNDVGDDPDQLPILQHALMRTWDCWEADASGGPLDFEHYQAVGQMEQALSQHAEEAYAELDSDLEREVAEKLFKALTDKDPDSRRGIRRPIRLKEVCVETGANEEEVISVVERFRQQRRSFLMPPVGIDLHGDSILDISHESLMRVWKRLIAWVDEETQSAQFYLRVAEAGARFEEGSAGLWHDPELEFALQWQEENRPTAAWAQRYDPAFDRTMSFLKDSKKERDRAREVEERERKKKLQRARRLATILGSAALLTLALSVFALQQRNAAQGQKAKAEQLAEEADEARQRAELSAEEALRQKEGAEKAREVAEQERRAAVAARTEALEQKGIADKQRSRAETQEQRARIEKSNAEQARDVAERAEQTAEKQRQAAEHARVMAEESELEARRLGILELARSLAIRAPRLQEEGQEELAALLAVTAHRLTMGQEGDSEAADIYLGLWQTLKRLPGKTASVFDRQPDVVRALSVAPDGGKLAAGGDDGAVRLLDLGMPKNEPEELLAGGSEVRAVAYSPDGRRLAAAALDGSIRIWEPSRSTEPLQVLNQSEDGAADAGDGDRGIYSLAFSNRGLLASGHRDGEVKIWDLEHPEQAPRRLPAGDARRISSLAWDGDQSLAAASDSGALIWDLRQETEPRVLLAGEKLRSIAFNRDGQLLACGYANGAISVLETASGTSSRTLQGHTAGVHSVSFGPDRDLLASASSDGTVRLWNLEAAGASGDVEPVVLADHDGWVWTAVFTPGGERLLSGGADRKLLIWPTRAASLVETICARVSRNLTREEWSRNVSDDLAYETTCPDRS